MAAKINTHFVRRGRYKHKFFHRKASQRNQTNKISKIRNDGGMVFYDEDNIEKGLTSHFEATSKCCDPKPINEVAKLVEGTLDDEMREIMNKDFTKEEVK